MEYCLGTPFVAPLARCVLGFCPLALSAGILLSSSSQSVREYYVEIVLVVGNGFWAVSQLLFAWVALTPLVLGCTVAKRCIFHLLRLGWVEVCEAFLPCHGGGGVCGGLPSSPLRSWGKTPERDRMERVAC